MRQMVLSNRQFLRAASCALMVVLLHSAAHAVDVTSNLVMYYKLDETSGSVAVDSAPGAQNGSYVNGTANGSPAGDASTVTVPGQVGTAINFAASGFRLVMDQTTVQKVYGATGLTMAAWVNPTVSGGDGVIAELNANASMAHIRLNANQLHVKVRAQRADGVAATGPGYEFTEGGAQPVGTWVHLEFTVTYGTGGAG